MTDTMRTWHNVPSKEQSPRSDQEAEPTTLDTAAADETVTEAGAEGAGRLRHQ